jgi:Cu+-exporting ATPase
MAETKLVVPVQGMTCASCVAHVTKALSGVEGVGDANVNLATERASVTFDPGLVNLGNLVDAVQETGYEIPTETTILPIGGMTCASCTDHVEKALSKVSGVSEVNVNLATEKATVTFVPGVAGPVEFKRAVADAGYEVLEVADAGAAEAEQEDEAERKMRDARFRHHPLDVGRDDRGRDVAQRDDL